MQHSNLGAQMSQWVLVVRKRLPAVAKRHDRAALREALRRGWLGPHRGHERLNAHDVHDTGEIVGQHVQRHL